jgi:hypothetical protein
MIPVYWRALPVLVVILTGTFAPARADPIEALAAALATAFTPVQMSELIVSTAGQADPRADMQLQSIDRLGRLLDVVRVLLRILDRPDIEPAGSAQALAQAAIQFHAVTDRLGEFIADDAEGQRLVTEAQAAMRAGQFNATEALLRRIEAREVGFSDRSADGEPQSASSITQHLISAAQAGTVLGEIALMRQRYGEATAHFQTAQRRLALLSTAEPDPASPGPDDMLPAAAAETPPREPAARTDAGAPVVPADRQSAAAEPLVTATNAAVAVIGASPGDRPERAPAAQPSGAGMSADMISLLMRRGDTLLALGDLSSARLLYARAAAGGDARGATGAGKTFDPVFLLIIGARGIRGDAVAAADWYRRAVELGDRSAAERLARMSQRSER